MNKVYVYSWLPSALLLVLLVLGVQSCRPPEAAPVAPTVSFGSGPEYTDRSQLLPPGARIQVRFIAGRADSPLSRITISLNGQPYTPYRDKGTFVIADSAQQFTFRDSLSFIMPSREGERVVLTFRAEDRKGQSGEATLTFGIANLPTTTDTVVLYSQGPYTAADTAEAQANGWVLGSTYSSSRKQVYDSLGLFDNTVLPLIDLNFGVDTAGRAVLVAPEQRTALTGQLLISGSQATRFDTSAVNFDQANGTAIFNLVAPDTIFTVVEQGRTYRFVNGQNRKGLLIVDELTFDSAMRPRRIRFRIKMLA